MDQIDPRTVVYIEDDPEMIDLVSLILKNKGFIVKGAAGGRDGIDLVVKENPDLVLLDLMMPDVDGWEVYQQLRSLDSSRKTPVIIITARAQMIDKVLGLHIARVNDYICKPFKPQELTESIQRTLSQHLISNGN